MSDDTVAAELARALFEAGRELGRTQAAIEGLRLEVGELRGFVQEQLTVNYGDLADRLKKLEDVQTGRRANWKLVTAIGAGAAGLVESAHLVWDWLKRGHS
jgi:hypothetical protein